MSSLRPNGNNALDTGTSGVVDGVPHRFESVHHYSGILYSERKVHHPDKEEF
jgi:hypothetical protein